MSDPHRKILVRPPRPRLGCPVTGVAHGCNSQGSPGAGGPRELDPDRPIPHHDRRAAPGGRVVRLEAADRADVEEHRMRRSILVWAAATLAVPARPSTAIEELPRSRTFEVTYQATV